MLTSCATRLFWAAWRTRTYDFFAFSTYFDFFLTAAVISHFDSLRAHLLLIARTHRFLILGVIVGSKSAYSAESNNT
jgi:hypothetical protein